VITRDIMDKIISWIVYGLLICVAGKFVMLDKSFNNNTRVVLQISNKMMLFCQFSTQEKSEIYVL